MISDEQQQQQTELSQLLKRLQRLQDAFALERLSRVAGNVNFGLLTLAGCYVQGATLHAALGSRPLTQMK